jgi:hypothetical protein
MSGIHRGVQARIRERIPNSTIRMYKVHVLNLVIVHSSSDVSVRTMMSTVQEITFAFHYTSKKLINLSKNYVGPMREGQVRGGKVN